MHDGKLDIVFHPSGKRTRVKADTSLRAAADKAGISLRFPCGGKGNCGKCKVLFEAGAPEPTATELDRISETEIDQGFRLACQAVLRSDAVVYSSDGMQPAKILVTGTVRHIPPMPVVTKGHAAVDAPNTEDLRSNLSRALDAFGVPAESAWTDLKAARQLAGDMREAGLGITGVFASGTPISWEEGDTTGECRGLAVDIGTTTIAAYLMDLVTGKQLAVAAAVNPQTRVGDDVISRISYVMQEPEGLERLRNLVVDELNGLISVLLERSEVSRDTIYEAVVVGNTCMTHLFLGIDPRSLAIAPYVPVVSSSFYLKAGEVGLEINPAGRVYVLPSISSYVGADTLGVVLATDLYESEKYVLAVDVGTNGEIALGCRDRILACSTAAGPAFEGAHIKHGMRAAPGAIDAVWLDEGQVGISTVDGAPAVGICGSGLLDAIICMVEAGIIEASGRIVDAEELSGAYSHLGSRLRPGQNGQEFVLVPGEQSAGDDIVVTQRDVREVQLAKGAIAAGIGTLLDRAGISSEDLDRLVLAGAFGNYIRKESAIAAGLLPNIPRSKVHSVGNAAGEGSKLALISSDIRSDAERIARSVEYVELTTDPGFQDRFADSLMFGSQE